MMRTADTESDRILVGNIDFKLQLINEHHLNNIAESLIVLDYKTQYNRYKEWCIANGVNSSHMYTDGNPQKFEDYFLHEEDNYLNALEEEQKKAADFYYEHFNNRFFMGVDNIGNGKSIVAFHFIFTREELLQSIQKDFRIVVQDSNSVSLNILINILKIKEAPTISLTSFCNPYIKQSPYCNRVPCPIEKAPSNLYLEIDEKRYSECMQVKNCTRHDVNEIIDSILINEDIKEENYSRYNTRSELFNIIGYNLGEYTDDKVRHS